MVSMGPSEVFPAEFIVVGVGDISHIVIANGGCASDAGDGGGFSTFIGQRGCIYRVVDGVGKATDIVGDGFRNGDRWCGNGVSVTPSSIISGAVLVRVGELLGTGAVGDVRDYGRFSYRLQSLPASIRDSRKQDGIGCRLVFAMNGT